MSSAGPVRLEREGGLAVVSIDHPPLNLFDQSVEEALERVLDGLEEQPARAVLFRAEGRVLSAGVDVGLFEAQPDVQHAIDLFNRLLAITRRTEALACPTVFAAHALCLTWAFELALACDLILAASSAEFGLVERVIGLTPAMGGTQRLAERAGSGRARELVMTGERYSAQTLETWNVVNRVLPDEDFDQQCRAFAGALAQGPTLAHTATKRVVQAFREGGVSLADERVAAVAGELFDTEDLRGAVRSFLAEGPGKAAFSGR
ncbi:MAG TPA: enoyl-CoA hydratase/isomerase family protein [Solirubrobacteraceae bacterium]|jgi:enoyl-CoA hydratase/carnithine racemase|nr:enoyl-CoA hydratase/isomerase family protein [Solirubrobacteraceae bacterium]